MPASPSLIRFTRPLLIGHRGYPAKFPENTLAGFQGAIQAGCGMIELDVALTKDRRVVVIHDDTLDRTTTGTGAVKDHSFEEIKRLDAGSWFDPFFSSERVPDLAEVLELSAGRCLLNIEIKESAFEPDCPADAIEHQVIKLLQAGGAVDRVIVSSFDARILRRLAATETPPAVALITSGGLDMNVWEILAATNAFSWHPGFAALSRDQVDRLHAAGRKVFPWTINTREEAERILALGVDGLICNDLRIAPIT